MLLNKLKKISIIDWMAILVIFLYLLSFIIINFKGQYIFYDSDMYADTLISKYMWNSKSIFPSGWVFGNQCFVIGTPVIASLIYGVCNNMFLSISIATTIVTLIIMFIFVWMLKPFYSKKSILIGVLILLASAIGCEIAKQIEGQLLYLTVSYYSSYMITLLLASGCFARIVEGKKPPKALIFLSLLLSLACGMQSLRQTALMVLPLIMCCFIFRKKECIIYATEILVFNVIGIVIIKFFDPSFYTIYGNTNISSVSNFLSKILNGFDAIKKISGLRWLLKGNIVGLFGLLLLTIAIVVLFIVIFNRKNNGIRSLVFIFVFGIISTIGASVFTNVNLRYIYIFSYFPLVAVCCSYLVDIFNNDINNKMKSAGYLLSILLIVGSFGNLFISYWSEVNESLFYEDNSVEKSACEYINDNNYNYVYMNWDHLGKCVNLNDNVVAGAWYGRPFRIIGYLNAQDVYDENHNKEAVYWLYENEVENAIEIANKNNAIFNKIAEFNNGEIQLFVSDKQLMKFDK